MSNQAARDAENRKLIRRIMLGLLASVLFAVGMVPLYNVLCEATGFNGKTSGQASLAAKPLNVDQSRWVKVEFTSNVMPGLPWQFAPLTASVNVRPGQMQMVKYIAKNITSVASEGQAIPSITPGQAAQYFKKIECFCFQRQQLKPGESREMPLTFYVSPDIPPEITTITLSYAFFSAVKQNQKLSLAGAPALGQ